MPKEFRGCFKGTFWCSVLPGAYEQEHAPLYFCHGVFIDRFIFRSNLLWMRLPWECHRQSQDTNWRHCVTGPELPFFHKRKGVLKIDRSVKMPWHRLSHPLLVLPLFYIEAIYLPVLKSLVHIYEMSQMKRLWFTQIYLHRFYIPELTLLANDVETSPGPGIVDPTKTIAAPYSQGNVNIRSGSSWTIFQLVISMLLVFLSSYTLNYFPHKRYLAEKLSHNISIHFGHN